MKQSHTPHTQAGVFANDKRNLWALYAAFALFNIILAVQYRAPFAYPDEYGVFAIGNWMFKGTEWSYKSNMYYGYTFSPFAGIMLRLLHGIRPIYIGLLCIKALQVSLIPVLSYKFLHEVLETKDPRVKLLLSTAVSLYPSLTLYAKYVSNETTLHVTLFICLYLIGKLAVGQSKNTTRLYSALLGFFAVFAYATHGMGLAFIVAVCLVVPVAHIGTQKKLVSYPFFVVALAFFYFLDTKIKAVVMDAVNYIPENGAANTLSFGLNNLITRLFEPGFVLNFFGMVASKLLYISASTFGMFLLAFIILLIFVFRFARARFSRTHDPHDNALFVTAVFGMVIFFCGVGLSTLNSVPEAGASSRAYFYGRYYEYMALPLILIGLQRLFVRSVKKMELLKYYIISFVCYVLLSVYTQFMVMPFVSDELNSFFVLGILPYIGNIPTELFDVGSDLIPQFDLIALWLFSGSVFILMVYLLKGKRRFLALFLLSGMFLYGTLFDHVTAVLPLSVANYNSFYSNMEPIESALGEFKDIYDHYPKLFVFTNKLGAGSSSSSLIRGRAQLSFVRYNVTLVLSPDVIGKLTDAEEGFRDSILVSDQDLEILNTDDAYLKIYESPNACIWIRGDKIRAYYDNREP